MKTQEQIQQSIDDIMAMYPNPDSFEKKVVDKARKEVNFLQRCLKYLKSDCEKEKYLKRELETLENRLEFIDNNYGKWCGANPDIRDKYENPLPAYRREMKRAKVVKQIETVKYLII